ncbi:MAG: PAS domain S-box protein [Haloarculaceae archaeon]
MSETSDTIRVLFVGDDLAAPLESALGATGDDAVVTAAGDVETALSLLSADHDCVVYDAGAVETSPSDAIERFDERAPHLPVVLVTDDGLDSLVAADLVSAVTAVVRPGDDAATRLADHVRRAAAARRERTMVRRTHDGYRALVEQLPVPVVVLRSGTVVFANGAAAEFLDHPEPAGLVGESLASFLPAATGDSLGERLAAVAETGRPMPRRQVELRTAADEEKWATLAAHSVDYEGDAAVQLVLTDITEHKRLGARLRDQLDRFAALFENLSEPVVESRFDGETPVVESVNPAFEETFGVSADDIVGSPLDESIVPDDRQDAAAEFNRRAREGERLEVEVRRETADGPRDFLLRTVPFEQDDATRGYAIYIDVTERRERERQLERQNERLEEVARVVSHDLRNPLNVAQGNVDLLADGADADDRPAFERVQRAHERMEAIIDDMLTLARQGQSVSDLEPVALDAVARDAWETAGTETATLDVRTDVRILADRSRLLGVFENLFANAHMHAGEDVTITVDAIGDGERTGTAIEESRGFFVEDDGPGIPESDRESVFESGYSTASDSTGFGLAIVQSIVEAHGWDVTVTESESGGARFEITGVGTAD